MAQSFLGESIGVNDTGDSEKPRNIAALGRFVYWLDDKTGLKRITVNEERRRSGSAAQSSKLFPQLHSQRGGCGTQYSRRLLVPQASDAAGGQGELRRVSGLWARFHVHVPSDGEW
ncbi:uncharacterized protein LOC6598212 [Drosophila persimilis]|uniref:uncharacterized protein LOC6598212 n=1 Tax=Drosophila persimilis TaxID=7234 RepID=UPI000F09904A|nr:uncharacterized protein LOC6598212 [Drosophila persimilis]